MRIFLSSSSDICTMSDERVSEYNPSANRDIVTDDDTLADLAAQNQHG